MDEEPFNGPYFQHLLASLTLNSRALIVELTGIAEKYPEDAGFMVDQIEERINKILPKYKLYSFYLMDSIVKNIGNPYNVLFAKNLFKLFTETYLIVDDTNTRQNLINLFKTWMSGQTSAGLHLFPQETLLRIEKFIIKATSLASDGASQDAARVSRDVILREANYLLQYIIAIDGDLEKIVMQMESQETQDAATLEEVRKLRSHRNNIIFEVNGISEQTMGKRKEDFEACKAEYLRRLQEIRKDLDSQVQLQKSMQEGLFSSPLKSEEQQTAPQIAPPREISIDLFFAKDDAFLAYVDAWGQSCVQSAVVFAEETPSSPAEVVLEASAPNPSELASSLGIDIESCDFDEYNSSMSTADKDLDFEDDDGYDPESTIIEEKHSPPTSPLPAGYQHKSSLKRPSSGEARPVKRVRFDI